MPEMREMREMREMPEVSGPRRAPCAGTALAYLTLVALLGACALDGPRGKRERPVVRSYPEAPRSDQVDVLHDVRVEDPFRPLEDPDAPEVREWIAAENDVTTGYLDKIPYREELRAQLTRLWNYERFGIPRKAGGRYFYEANDGLLDQNLVLVADSPREEGEVLFDPNTFSEDGTVALADWEPSEDGRYVAYAISRSGSDWREIRVREVATGEDLPDEIRWAKFTGISWRHDGLGFYYSRYHEPAEGEELEGINYFHKLYFHRLGTPQWEDELVYERPDQKEWGFAAEVTDDDRYLVVEIWQGTEERNRVAIQDLSEDGGSDVSMLLRDFDASYDFVGNDGTKLWFRTDRSAPLGRVVAIDVEDPRRDAWVEVIPESDAALVGVTVVGDYLVARYLRDARSEVKTYSTSGELVREVDLPGIGSVGGFEGSPGEPDTFYSFTSFTVPTTIYRYDVETGAHERIRQPELPFRPAAFVTEQVFYESADGTRVPMFLTYRSGLQKDGNHPVHLYGYGGFNIPITPSFSPANLAWVRNGGIFAVANIRGGGEYGREWHLAGTKANKQNVFDDFIAAGEWLIENGYTRAERLGISGGSNGGLLVGACITQRPRLFGAAVPRVGVLDMLRFHKFTIGWAWTSDYGSPDDPEDFAVLRAYSPLHNVRRGIAYPATMIVTADHDDRVVPAHSFKFAAALQDAQSGPEPILIRIETKAGHGAGKPVSKQIAEATDILAFLFWELGVQDL